MGRGNVLVVRTPDIVGRRTGERGDGQHADGDDPESQAGRARRVGEQRAGSGRLAIGGLTRRSASAGRSRHATAASRSCRVNGLAITC